MQIDGLVPTCDEIAILTAGSVRPPCSDAANLPGLVSRGISVVLVATVFLAFIYLLLGGLKFIVSGGDKEKMAAARRTMVNAVLGLVVVFLSFTIMQIVGQVLGFQFNQLSFPIRTVN